MEQLIKTTRADIKRDLQSLHSYSPSEMQGGAVQMVLRDAQLMKGKDGELAKGKEESASKNRVSGGK